MTAPTASCPSGRSHVALNRKNLARSLMSFLGAKVLEHPELRPGRQWRPPEVGTQRQEIDDRRAPPARVGPSRLRARSQRSASSRSPRRVFPQTR